jgi:hypothetical protein
MKQKPPYYTLDTETRRFAELVTYWARQLESVQQPPLDNDMMSVIVELESRLGLMPPEDEPQQPADVVQLRPFRVVTTNTSEPQDEPR